MDKLYKYCPIYNSKALEKEYSIINLLSNQVTFSTRSNFNDPFDSKIDFIKPSKAEIKKVLLSLKGKEKRDFKELFCGESGVFQDSWHSLANFYAASFLGVSGFNVTAPIALQS